MLSSVFCLSIVASFPVASVTSSACRALCAANYAAATDFCSLHSAGAGSVHEAACKGSRDAYAALCHQHPEHVLLATNMLTSSTILYGNDGFC